MLSLCFCTSSRLCVCVLFCSQDKATSQPSLKRYKHLTVPPLPPRQTVTPSDWPPVTSTWTTWETALGTLPILQLVLNTSFPPIPARIVLPNLQSHDSVFLIYLKIKGFLVSSLVMFGWVGLIRGQVRCNSSLCFHLCICCFVCFSHKNHI